MKIRTGIVASALYTVFGLSAGMGACAQSEAAACENIRYGGANYTVCKFDPSRTHIRTYLNDLNGAPYGNFAKLAAGVGVSGKTLVFAMNGGMYHADRSPVGLYIENRVQYQKININKGPGNFHMLPNGVFYMGLGGADVLRADVFAHAKLKIRADYATQSGPMLVIDGALHPKFNKDSQSMHTRNGVGVKDDMVYFVISNEKVNFHSFASVFKDHLGTPNALYLDGSVSKIYAPEIGRNDTGRSMGPIIAVTREAAE